MQTETFKDIEGYEGLYQVSDIGNVYSLVSDKVRKPGVCKDGYSILNLNLNGVKKRHFVHRLVSIAFLENPEKKEQVNHIDGNKTNNSLSNLEWCTQSENLVHSRDVLGNITDKAVVQISIEGTEIAMFNSLGGAYRSTGVNRSDITKACRGKRKTAGGFFWKYA